MNKSIEKKLRFNDNLIFWTLFALTTVLFLLSQLEIRDLQYQIDELGDEIGSIPIYRCNNEIVTRTVNISNLEDGDFYYEGVMFHHGEEVSGNIYKLYFEMGKTCKINGDIVYRDAISEESE